MGIGFRELMVLMILAAVGVVIILLIIRSAGKSIAATGRRTVAERLAELESLRKAEQITAAEYEKQRATIVSSV